MYVPECYNLLPFKFKFTPAEIVQAAELPFVEKLFIKDKPNIYLAQAITTNQSIPKWMIDFIYNYEDKFNLINPAIPSFRYPRGTPTNIMIKMDIFMCSTSKYIMLDLTKGPSVGATIETAMSYIMNKTIIGIKDSDIAMISFFTEYLCTHVLTTDASLFGYITNG